jgi:ParB family chromosome partitioning protein
VSTERPDKSPVAKRKLIKESPFARLTQRTEETGEEALRDARLVNINRITSNPNNPRRNFSDKTLLELSSDIKARGILHPPIVRPVGDRYEIVVGERRFRAARLAGLTQIPVLVQDLSDEESKIISLVENIQREDLTFEDEARYFSILQKEYSYSIRDIAKLVNKSKSYVDARLTLLKHPDIMYQVQQQKLGLHEATLLARMGIKYDELDEKLEETVREKDSPQNSETVREKDISGVYPLVQPIKRLKEILKNTRKKVEMATSEERRAFSQALNELEEEIQIIKYRLGEM